MNTQIRQRQSRLLAPAYPGKYYLSRNCRGFFVFLRFYPRTYFLRTGNCTGPASSTLLRSEEHTSELQSRFDLVCRLLLEKKKNNINFYWIVQTNNIIYKL